MANRNEAMEEDCLNGQEAEDEAESESALQDAKPEGEGDHAGKFLTFLIGIMIGFGLGAAYFSPNKESAPPTTPVSITQTQTQTSFVPATQAYEVQHGECWESIAQQYHVSVDLLLQINPQKQAAPQFDQLGRPYLYAGEVINVPIQ